MGIHTSRRRAAAALLLASSIAIAGCSKSGGSDSSKTETKADKTTTTVGKTDGTTTTEGETEPPTDALDAALEQFDHQVGTATDDRVAAQKAGDLDAAKTAIAAQRTAYYDFDRNLRDFEVGGSDAAAVSELLFTDGDVIDNLDQYAQVSDGDGYNSILYKEVASVNSWRRQVTDLAEAWDVDFEIEPLSLQEGYVGAGERIHSLQTQPGAVSFEVPEGFAGEDDQGRIDVRGPKDTFIDVSVTNASEDDERPSADELEAYTQDYAEAVVDKAGGEIVGEIEQVEVGDGIEAWAYSTVGQDYGSRDVLLLDPESGDVLAITLYTSGEDALERLLPRFEALLESFEIAS